MSAMQETMEKIMAHMVKPEDMPAMMGAMMDRMFAGMSAEDCLRFVTSMMPRCLTLVMADMSAGEKQALARELVDKLVALLRPVSAQGSSAAAPAELLAASSGG